MEKATRLNLILCFIFVSQRIVNNASQSFCFTMLSPQNPNAATSHRRFPFPLNQSCLANSNQTPLGFIYNCFLAVCKIGKVDFVIAKWWEMVFVCWMKLCYVFVSDTSINGTNDYFRCLEWFDLDWMMWFELVLTCDERICFYFQEWLSTQPSNQIFQAVNKIRKMQFSSREEILIYLSCSSFNWELG